MAVVKTITLNIEDQITNYLSSFLRERNIDIKIRYGEKSLNKDFLYVDVFDVNGSIWHGSFNMRDWSSPKAIADCIEGQVARRVPTTGRVDYTVYYANKINTGANPLDIKDVIFNDPATIVFWEDGTKTVVKAQDGEPFDPEKGLAMAISKKALGNQGNYYNVFTKWCPEMEEEEITADKVRWSEKEHSVTGTINLDASMVESLKKLGKAAQEVGFAFAAPPTIRSLKDLK